MNKRLGRPQEKIKKSRENNKEKARKFGELSSIC